MKFWQVDSFTDEVFKGNPAAVFINEQKIPAELMRKIAMEMNLSETAFVTPGETLEIRWFTPGAEVDLCGHATLAAAHVLFEQGFITGEEVSFQSKSGLLAVRREREGYTLDFPAQPGAELKDHYDVVKEILDKEPLYVGSNGGDLFAVVDDSEFVRSYSPDIAGISRLKERGFLLTAADSEVDYIYRGFFPKLNIVEDPVTGSANTCLGSYWSKRLNKDRLSAFQASERGGYLTVQMQGDRVLIGGKAVTVFEANGLFSL